MRRQYTIAEARMMLESNPFPPLDTQEGRWFSLGFLKALERAGQISTETFEQLFMEYVQEKSGKITGILTT
jgi:hypothetical protein